MTRNRPSGRRRPADLRPGLRADCGRCAGLCCVATSFARSADFAISKPAGRPCPHLRPDFGCSIHGQLAARGFPGCAAYDCFGAGQQVVSVTFGGRDWRSEPELAGPMFAAFAVVRQLHELLWYLSEALAMAAAAPLRTGLAAAVAQTRALTAADAGELAGLDVAAHWAGANTLLQQASELARAGPAGPGPDLRGADLAGADLRHRDLRGANLRGACLIGARLPGADLAGADLAGADLRATDLRGADLAGALFVTRPAVAAARTDAATRLPPALSR